MPTVHRPIILVYDAIHGRCHAFCNSQKRSEEADFRHMIDVARQWTARLQMPIPSERKEFTFRRIGGRE